MFSDCYFRCIHKLEAYLLVHSQYVFRVVWCISTIKLIFVSFFIDQSVLTNNLLCRQTATKFGSLLLVLFLLKSMAHLVPSGHSTFLHGSRHRHWLQLLPSTKASMPYWHLNFSHCSNWLWHGWGPVVYGLAENIILATLVFPNFKY